MDSMINTPRNPNDETGFLHEILSSKLNGYDGDLQEKSRFVFGIFTYTNL